MSATRPLHDLSIAQAGAALRAGTVTSVQLTQHALDRIEDLNGDLDAFILITSQRALEDAANADADFAAGIDTGPMQGIPYALKDIYDTKGIRTTCHSALLRDHVPDADCVVQEKLAAGGGVLLGKLGTFEFAIGGPSFDLPFPPARNPWRRSHISGGSSSGSGTAVAAGMVRMALGSDTGGSIRWPAAVCGIVGMKPTYGLVSRRGIFPLSYTLDHAGPLAQTVEDAAISLSVMAGHDPLDPASADVPVGDYLAGLNAGINGLRVGYTRQFFLDQPACNADIVAALDNAAQVLRDQGALVEEVPMPAYAYFAACQQTIMFAEAYAIHEKDIKTRPMAFGARAYASIVGGALLSAADYVQALRLRAELTAHVNGLLGEYDVLLTPSALATAQPFEGYGANFDANGIMTGAFNVTGHPAMALPIGFAANGLPLGGQLVGRPFDEAMVFRVGAALEASLGAHLLRPGQTLAAA
ncbi:MAG: amidase [Pelagibacterium sp. SCN 63-23]|nr:MAG: amidase [Pelagibacterium sp. SCN 63-23]